MTDALLIVSAAFLVAGGFFLVTGGIGLHRLPDFYSRTHAGGLTDTLGAGLTLLGLVFRTLAEQPADWGLVVVKLLLILVFLFFTSPGSGYALVRAAFTQGHKPRLAAGQVADERLWDGELVREKEQ
ncbi:MAG: monovalent cation/H(+) antiporter subunit G [Planctomycetota bacterium]|nr:monovalent cation/H(+) antiporter subunit G [Planctomycetota bacterium]MED5449095.1 monovalent cation/H(+) antiporter subunit G [Planctomycetota bacterium]